MKVFDSSVSQSHRKNSNHVSPLTIVIAAAYLLARVAVKDTNLMLPRKDDVTVKEPVSIKKGNPLILDMVGMCKPFLLS